jgi:uncharacterized protein YceK
LCSPVAPAVCPSKPAAKAPNPDCTPESKAGSEYNEGAANATGLGSALGPAIVTLDRPFSFALDTALLPFDLLGSIFGGKKEKATEPETPQPKPAPQP